MTFANTRLAPLNPALNPALAALPPGTGRAVPAQGTRPAAQSAFADQLSAARRGLDRPGNQAQAPSPAPVPVQIMPPELPLFDPSLLVSGLAGDAAGVLARIKTLFEQAALAAPEDQDASGRPAPGQPLFGRIPMPRSGGEGLGGLSARFESGGRGIEAIGYDEVGGTSYGKFQIASRVGSMDRFIGYLKDRAPDLATRLKNAGPANTRSTRGTMPEEWKRIAQENPKRFEELQNNFIRDTYYSPAMDKVLERTGVDVRAFPPALKEVLWSTAVQHGPDGAANIFSQAISNLPEGRTKEFAKGLIQEVYATRKGQFGSSSAAVRAGVQNRLVQESEQAVGMLQAEA